jgi:outer membrane usher protein
MANRSSCRWPRNRFARLLLLSVLATDLSAAGPDVPQVLADSAFDAAAASLAGETLFLEVLLNGAATGRILRFVHENGRFHAGADSLRLLGFDMKPGAGAIDLGTLEGVGIDYDAQRQRIDIAAPALLASQSRTRLNDATAGIPRPQASPGALVNYDLYATADESGARSVSAFAELRSFGRLGVFSTSWLGRGWCVFSMTYLFGCVGGVWGFIRSW